MVKALGRLSLCTILVSALPVTVATAAAPAPNAAPDVTLNWRGKTSDSPRAGQYGIPPSPYGEVGDFFRKDLNWAGKTQSNAQSQTAPKATQPPMPVAAAAPVASPEPVLSPRPSPYVTEAAATFSYRPRAASTPKTAAPVMTVASVNAPALPAPPPRLTTEALRELEAAGAVRHTPAPVAKPTPVIPAPVKPVAKAAPPPVTMAPIPNPKPVAPVQTAAPAKPKEVAQTKAETKPATQVALTPAPSAAEQTLTVAPDPDAYQIPPTSKYYRGPAVSSGAADSAAADQSARYYSLHRDYGLVPDSLSNASTAGDNLPVAQTAEPKP